LLLLPREWEQTRLYPTGPHLEGLSALGVPTGFDQFADAADRASGRMTPALSNPNAVSLEGERVRCAI